MHLLFPHQLFYPFPEEQEIVLWEHPLYFSQYPFHQQKLVLHRASMRAYADALQAAGKKVTYWNFNSNEPELFFGATKETVTMYNVVDDYLERAVRAVCRELSILDTPNFFLRHAEVIEIFGKKKRFLLFDFYKQQRKKTGWLMAGEEPLGGVWSLDAENRRKLPKGHVAPLPWFPSEDDYVAEAKEYVAQHFPDAFGEVKSFYFPIHRKDALQVLQDFVENRLAHYGEYQDAIDGKQSWVYHSILTPALNIGLLSPHEVCQTVIDFYDKNSHLPLNAVEGFIRQVLGWREYIRAIYVVKGREERTKNFWQFKRKIPASWWQGTTGIPPVDDVIQKIQQTGYAHHIERLMVLGNFMCLCEFDPDEVHAWFMALFIDAYDWVMVPNVYGMSQYADGGIMSTKPYISGSNYIHKMSHYPKGAWSEVWDALFWRFIFQHRSFFLSNPRLSMMVRTLEKMPEAKQRAFIDQAEQYLINLDSAGEIS